MIQRTNVDHEFWEWVDAHFPNQKEGKVEAFISNGLVEKYKVFSAEYAEDGKRATGALGHDSLTRMECGLLRRIIAELQLSCYCEWHYGFRGFYSVTLKKVNFHSFTVIKLIGSFAKVNKISCENNSSVDLT